MRILYTEYALKDPNVPAWASSQIQSALCPANLEPEFRLHPQSHGLSDLLTIDQLLTPVQVPTPFLKTKISFVKVFISIKKII